MSNQSKILVPREQLKQDYKVLQEIENAQPKMTFLRTTIVLFGLFFVMLFLPWTQNIRARGKLTTLRPEQREQAIHTIISGRVEKWFVREGQLVSFGDTILQVSEIKDEYLDPNLLKQVNLQIEAKEASINAYNEKVTALKSQRTALTDNRGLKLKQAKNKVQQNRLYVIADSMNLETEKVNLEVAKVRYKRQETLRAQGLSSQTDLETRQLSLQMSENKVTAAESKLIASRNEYLNSKIELNSIQADYGAKIAKIDSDINSTQSQIAEGESDLSKMEVYYSNLQKRTGFYFITAPQDGFVTKATAFGIGETVKEGDEVFTFIPSNYDFALEMYVRPMDLPLIRRGNDVRIQFDGWPAIVFSGWPGMSFGTFGGEIVAFDNATGPDGRFRVLVAPDSAEQHWPEMLRLGTGAQGIALLNTVPVWYEIWRTLNGFPPEFYLPNGKSDDKPTEVKL